MKEMLLVQLSDDKSAKDYFDLVCDNLFRIFEVPEKSCRGLKFALWKEIVPDLDTRGYHRDGEVKEQKND